MAGSRSVTRAVVVSLLAVGLAGGQVATAQSADDSVLTFTRISEFVPVIHPVEATSNTYMLLYLVYNGLVKVDRDSRTVLPDLAESWEASDDATSFTFHLRPGVMWQDGTPFTSADVVGTITWACQNISAYKGFAPSWPEIKGCAEAKDTTSAVAGVEAPDDSTVTITLNAGNAEFLRSLADAQNLIFAEHVFADIPGADVERSPAVTTTPVGTGPYSLVSMDSEQAEFAANPDYFAGAPQIDRVIYKTLSPEAAVAQLQSGDLDLGLRIPTTEYDTLAANPALKVDSVPDVGIIVMQFTTDSPVVTDKRVREAMYYAIDRRGIVDAVLKGRAKVLMNPPGFTEYPDLDTYPYDPDKARQLLADAGYDPSVPFKLAYNQETAGYPVIMPIIAQNLQDVGINVQLVPLDAQSWLAWLVDQSRHLEYDATMSDGGSEAISPDRTSVYFPDCHKPIYSQYTNCHMNELFAKARATTDETVRDAAYHEIAQILNTDLPQLYFWSPQNLDVSTTRLGGGYEPVPGFERYAVNNIETWTLAPKE